LRNFVIDNYDFGVTIRRIGIIECVFIRFVR